MKKIIVIGLILIAVSAIAIFALVQIGVFDDFIHGDARMVGRTAPPFILQTYDAREVSLADYKGDVVLIVFWSPT